MQIYSVVILQIFVEIREKSMSKGMLDTIIILSKVWQHLPYTQSSKIDIFTTGT